MYHCRCRFISSSCIFHDDVEILVLHSAYSYTYSYFIDLFMYTISKKNSVVVM